MIGREGKKKKERFVLLDASFLLSICLLVTLGFG
jgi:hypothetical protein